MKKDQVGEGKKSAKKQRGRRCKGTAGVLSLRVKFHSDRSRRISGVARMHKAAAAGRRDVQRVTKTRAGARMQFRHGDRKNSARLTFICRTSRAPAAPPRARALSSAVLFFIFLTPRFCRQYVDFTRVCQRATVNALRACSIGERVHHARDVYVRGVHMARRCVRVGPGRVWITR